MKHKPNPNNGNPNIGHLDTCADPETDPSRFQEFWKHKTARSNNYNPGQIHCQLGESALESAQGMCKGLWLLYIWESKTKGCLLPRLICSRCPLHSKTDSQESYWEPEWRYPPVNKGKKRKQKSAISSKDKCALHIITFGVILPAAKREIILPMQNTKASPFPPTCGMAPDSDTGKRECARQGKARTPISKYLRAGSTRLLVRWRERACVCTFLGTPSLPPAHELTTQAKGSSRAGAQTSLGGNEGKPKAKKTSRLGLKEQRLPPSQLGDIFLAI